MSCKYSTGPGEITWKLIPNEIGHCNIPGSKSETIFDTLFEPVEYAGSFTMEQKVTKNCNGKACKTTVVHCIAPDSLDGGDGMSVKSPDSSANFHTHPLACYEGGDSKKKKDQCIWGWASGEDMRESVVFSMRGNLIHLIFALEGVYGIQCNPYIIDMFKKEFSDNMRGMIVCVIENYFKFTHGFRNCVYNESKNKICTPYDWIIFANNFKLDNLLETQKERCSKNLSCKGTPNTRGKNLHWKDFLYGWDLENYFLSSDGHLTERNAGKHTEMLEMELPQVIKKINSIKKTGWKKGQWFKIQFSHNEILDGSIKDMLRMKPREIYKIWTSMRKRRDMSFGHEPIVFKTPLLEKRSCKLK